MATNPDGSYNNYDYMGPVAKRDPSPDSVPTPRPGAPIEQAPQPAMPAAPSWASADPNQDLSYQAFLRGAGMSEAQARSSAARQKTQLQAQLEAQRPVWAQSLQQGLQGALNNAAARGVNRSSNRIANQNLVEQGVNSQRAQAEANTANQIGNIDLGLQSTLAELANRRAEQNLAAQQRQYVQQQQDYENQLANYYLQQLLNGGQ